MKARFPLMLPLPWTCLLYTSTRKLERLKENAGAADVVLLPSEVSALDKILDTIPMSQVFGGSKIVKKA